MKYFVFSLLITLSSLTFAQNRFNADFEKDVRSIRTTLDGKKLIIKSKKWQKPGLGPSWRDYLVYDFESKSIRFFSRTGPYGGFSPNANYFVETEMSYLDRKRGPYEVTLLNLNTNEKKSWENEHFGLAVYDDGKVLATKAKTYKGSASVDVLSGVYLYNPEGGKKQKPKELIGKKEVLAKWLYNYDYGLDTDSEFFQLLSPDNLSSWGGDLYNTGYGIYKFYDLVNGNKQEFRVSFPGDTTSRPTNLVLAVDGKSAIMRKGSRENKEQWQDYFINADSGEKEPMSNHNTHKVPVHYQMKDGEIYQFDKENGVVMRFNTSSGSLVSDKVWYTKIPQTMLNGEDYKFVIASDKYMAAIPTKRTGKVADVIIYDLDTDAVVDNFPLYQKDKPKETASSYSTKTLYKSDLLNSYDYMSLPYTSGYASGREVTGLSGASSIGGGQVFAIGQVGSTASGNLILLSLTRYTASNGSEVSTYYVTIFDKDGNYKNSKEIGNVQRSSGGRTFAVVNFKVQREPYNTFSIVGEQQFEQRKTAFKITIEPSGNIH